MPKVCKATKAQMNLSSTSTAFQRVRLICRGGKCSGAWRHIALSGWTHLLICNAQLLLVCGVGHSIRVIGGSLSMLW